MILALFSTLAGMFMCYSLPDYIAAALGKRMPFWFYESQVRFSSSAACAAA
jgi:hypothetical protein